MSSQTKGYVRGKATQFTSNFSKSGMNINNTDGNVGSIKFFEKNSNGSNNVGIKGHNSITDNYNIVLPAEIGTVDKVLNISSVSGTDASCEWSYPGIEQHSTSTSPITYKVTVATKTSAHRYDGQGSSLGYLIDGKHSPYIDMIPGKTYRFDQSDSSNANHPIKFYTTATKDSGTEYTTGVKRFSSDSDNYANYDPPGTGTEAYVEIVVSDSTPALLFYQCQSHGLMGNQIQVKGVGGSGGGSALTYTNSVLQSDNNSLLRLTSSTGTESDIMFIAGNNITLGTSISSQYQLGNDITPPTTDLNFGYTVKMNSTGDRVLISTGAKSLHMYKLTNNTWSQLGNVIESGGNNVWTIDMDNSGDVVAFGNYTRSHGGLTMRGSTKVLKYTTSTNWQIVNTEIFGQYTQDREGESISLSGNGNVIATSSRWNDEAGTNNGQVRIFEDTSSGWNQRGSDLHLSGYSGDSAKFGRLIQLNENGNILAVFSDRDNVDTMGNVRFFQYANNTWTQYSIIRRISTDYRLYVYTLMELNNDGDIIALQTQNTSTSDYNLVVYSYSGSSWNQRGNLLNFGDRLTDLAIDNDITTIAVGNDQYSTGGLFRGLAKFYKYNNNTWSQIGTTLIGEASQHYMGGALSINSTGTRAIVGIEGYGRPTTSPFGKVEIYNLPGTVNNAITINSTGGSALTVKDENTALTTAATTLKFVGDGVTASGTGVEKTITISGGGGGSALTVKDENTALTTAATTLKFVGDGVTASGTGAEKTITISGGGGGTSLPSQTGNANKFLKTDGSSLTWATPSGGSVSSDSSIYAHLQPIYDSSLGTGSNNANQGIVTYRPFSSGAPLGSTSYSVGGITLDSNNQGIKLPSNGDYKMDFNINVRTVYTATPSEFTGALYKGSTIIQETFTFVRQVTSAATYESLNLTAIIKVEDYTTEVYYFKVFTDGNIGSGNTQIWGYDEGKGSQVTIMKVSAKTFTTANPLLANPSTADKGKIVTVNAAGDDLEYGSKVLKHNMNFKNIYETGQINLTGSNPTAMSNPAVHTAMNITITPQLTTSKVMITVNMIGEWSVNPNNMVAYLRRTINGVVTDIFPTGNENRNAGLGQFVISLSNEMSSSPDVCNFHYIDEPNTILQVRYDVMLISHANCVFYYNRTVSASNSPGGERGMSFMSAEEKFANDDDAVGAITSFTQEQALAGAGGTAAFTNAVSGIDTDYGSKDNLVDDKLYSDSSNSSLYEDQLCSLLKGGNAYWFYSVTFTTPQIITKYRIWGRGDGSTSNQNPRNWEFRAATDSSTYNATDSTTYTVLDSQVSATFNSYTSTANASDNLSLGNVYNLSTIGAYKYYVLHITANGNNAGTGNHSTHCTMSEIALYGGGFTIPSQIGHSGKILKTNGTALEWSTPVTGLLPAPVPENKGKIVTVNAAGDDLQYGANFRELACKQTIITNTLEITQANVLDKWADLASHNTNNNIHLHMNTETKINVSQNSKVEIKAQISVSHENNSNLHVAIRLGKKVGNAIIWGNSTGTISEGQDNAQTDPKGDVVGNRHPVWKSVNSQGGNDQEQYLLFNLNACYIDEDPTNGLSGYHDVTYFIRILKLYDPTDLYIGMPNDNSHYRTTVPTILSVTEIGSGALTSFTQEQALAGAGGTAAFTANVSTGGVLTSYGPIGNLFNNILYAADISGNNSELVHLKKSNNSWFVGIEFTTPQIVTKYRIWGRHEGNSNQIPKSWELRAANDSSTYNSGTHTVIDSQSNATFASYSTSGQVAASDNLNLGNEYNLSTIGAYKYYVIHITENYGNADYVTISELALYGGGFTIPSQVGHSGRLLTTDGTSLGWSTTSALPSVTVPEPTSTNKGKALVSTGTGIEFSDFNSGVSTGFKVYKSGTAFEEVTGGNAVLFDQTSTNVGAGSYSTTDGTYTVPVTGYYNIFANFTLPTVIWCGYANQAPSGGFYANYDDGTQIERFPGQHPGLINDTNGSFNTTTGIFTCSIPGIYRINLFSIGVTQSRANLGLYKNNAKLFEILDIASSGSYQDNGNTVIIKLISNDTLRIKEDEGDSEIMFSGELIKSGIDYRIQKSTNSGTSYTDLATSSDKPTTSIVESLNQNDLIRVISGDGSTGSTLNFEQGSTNNSFGAHLLNSGNSTSPIPIYGFNANLNLDYTSAENGIINNWSISGNNHFALPTANFNASSGVYTIPISGYYQINVIIRINNVNDFNRIYISVNNTTQAVDTTSCNLIFKSGHNSFTSGTINTVLKLNINDTISLKTQDSDGTVHNDDTHWSCFLLASDTQTNTRQMGLSPIVPLHQLGHDQFAEGKTFEIDISNSSGDQNLENSSSNGGLTVSQMGTILTKNSTYFLSNTEGNSVDSTTKLMYINRSGSKEFIVPSSPYTSGSNWTNNQDFIRIRVLKNYEGVEDYFYGIGSFTIDLSKILTNYIGMWNILINHDDDVRFKINGETFFIDAAGNDNRVISIFQKYINVEWTFWENTGNEYLYFDFYMVHPTSGMEIAEPVMPSITLPTPNSNNNGKVLVSNGSGYALQPHSGYVPVYGFFVEKSGDTNSTANGTIGNWNKNGSNHFTLPSNNYNLTTGVYTIPVSGYYQVNATIRVNNNAGNRVYVSVNNDTSTSGANITLSNFQDTNDKEAWSLNGVLKLNINDTIELKVQYQDLNIDHDDTHWSCMLLNTTEVNATPSINIPLPVAAHAGKALTVNSAGTGLEYGESSGGESKWLSNSNKIYYNTDNVGIGTDLSTNHHAGATSKLDVDGRITAKYLRISFRDTSSLNSHIIANREYNSVGWQAFPRALDMSDSGHGSNVNSFPDGDGVPLDIQQYRDIRNSNSSGGRGGAIIIRQAVRHENYWRIGCDTDTGADSELQFVFGTSGDGFQAGANSHANLTFTGQHRCIILNKTETEINNLLGQIVVSSGNYCNLDLTLNPTIDESLPIVDISNTENSKKCFGIISHIEEDDVKNEGKRLHKIGNSTSILSRATIDDRRMYVNSLGEGSIWVCNKNSNLENGDYISSSSVPGYGMKQTQNEGILTNYTVAKITSDCNFSLTKIVKQKIKITNNNIYNSNNQIEYEDDLDSEGNQQMIFPFETRFLQADATQITEEEYNIKLAAEEEVYIACFVGCTYHCG